MATGLSRPNYINGVDLANSTVLIRLAVNRNATPSDVVDTSTTHVEMSLADFAAMLGAATPAKPEIAALTAASTAANIVTALQA